MKLREGCYDVVGRKVELDEGEGVIWEVVQTVQQEVDDGGAGEVFGAANRSASLIDRERGQGSAGKSTRLTSGHVCPYHGESTDLPY